MRPPQTPWEQRHHRFGLAGEGQADIVEECLKLRRGMMLDVGCGLQGRHVDNLAKFSDWLVAVDHDHKMVSSSSADRNSRNASYAIANAYDLPFRGESFHCVVAFGLLAYVKDISKLLTEFRRVVPPAGLIVLTDSVSRRKEPVLDAAKGSGLILLKEAENDCPAASGDIKRRRLLIFQAS